MRPGLAALVLLLVFAAVACRGGSAAEDPTATPEPSATQAAPSATPTASPTPDPLERPPATQPEALAWAQRAIEGVPAGTCPAAVAKVGGVCAAGEATGDLAPDVAILLPVKAATATATAPFPAMVFVWSSQSAKLAPFAEDLTADASPLGSGFFQLADRTGDGRAELSWVQTVCGATGCTSRAVVLTWDGTAWRDIGPGDSVANIDQIAWGGEGARSIIAIHGGKLPASAPAESGPTRASTTEYKLMSGRYAVSSVEKDPPEYLYQAVQDADDAFDNDMASSQPAYTAVVEDTTLKDWKLKPTDADRRQSLVGYALFRLALIDAALGRDPTQALDRVIRDSKEPLFVYLAEAFRNGFQVRGGVVGGCAEANLYLRTPQGSGADPGGYVAQLFNYGYANPAGSKWIAKLCPF